MDDLEQWLVDFLHANPKIKGHYTDPHSDLSRLMELFKEDLRTATFLVRKGNDQFSFAHTSLLEFFLASYLYRALLEGKPERCSIPRPSPETLDFLGQLLEIAPETERQKALETMRETKRTYTSQASENLLEYMLMAYQKGYPHPSFAGFDLEGAKLKGWRFEVKDNQPLLNFTGSNFAGADLRDAWFIRVNLDNASFNGALLDRCWFLKGRAVGATFRQASLPGTVFRKVALRETNHTNAHFHRTQWLGCRLEKAVGLVAEEEKTFFGCCSPRHGEPPLHPVKVKTYTGHEGPVLSVAFSTDGSKIASGSRDKTIRVWDASSGKLVRTRLLLPEGQTAYIDSQGQLLWASEDAWPWLGWEEKREGRVIHWPIEMFWMLDEKFSQKNKGSND